ncbi:uncharacterized protein LOC128134186 [Lactuca sativa]|uniref:uncharacterized protein LOC128134186 n=1 Tax=Lactuca sativa TaxID=4236 RepID=UPI0022AF13BA|nr:uncharacterized protein LOC128134186 [Lactuca sativa]
MDFDDPEFLQNLREALRNIQEGGNRRQPRRGEHRVVEEFKVSELPKFVGGTDPERYLEWERKIEKNVRVQGRLKAKRTREGKEKICSWLSLKRKLRKRYVPSTYRIATYKKIVDLRQGKMNVGEDIDEFEKFSLIGDIEEIEEQKMTRFLKGLNYNIANVVELYPYADFGTICGLCLKFEGQAKARYGGSSSSSLENPKSKSWSKPESSNRQNSVSTPSGSSSVPVAPKLTSGTKDTSLAKIRCFKCQGFGHYQNACPNKRVVTLREAIECREELEEEERLAGIFLIHNKKRKKRRR